MTDVEFKDYTISFLAPPLPEEPMVLYLSPKTYNYLLKILNEK